MMFRNKAHLGLNMLHRRDDGSIGWVDPRVTATDGISPGHLYFHMSDLNVWLIVSDQRPPLRDPAGAGADQRQPAQRQGADTKCECLFRRQVSAWAIRVLNIMTDNHKIICCAGLD